MKLNWNFQRGGGVIGQIPSVGGDMDIFWNHTMDKHTTANTTDLHCIDDKQEKDYCYNVQ